jgi:hypothetical protein
MPYPKAMSNPTNPPNGMEIYGLHVRAQELPMDRVRKLMTNPATPPRTKPRRIFRTIISSFDKFTIPSGLKSRALKN